MPRRSFAIVSALSMLVCMAGAAMWARSYRSHHRIGLSTSTARYTLHSSRGRLVLTAPPPPGARTALAWKMASQINNADLEWTASSWYTRRWQYVVRNRYRPSSATQRIYRAFDFRTGMKSAAPPLLKALEDPNRAVAAHTLLRFLRQGMFHSPHQEDEDVITIYDDDVLPVTFRISDLKNENPMSPGLFTGPARADPLAWRNLRDLWHDRLDVQMISFSYAWPVVITMLPFLVWALRRWQMRRRPSGLCAHCGYNLRATPDQCPECGMPVTLDAQVTPSAMP